MYPTKIASKEQVAHHEAGHALIGYLLGWTPTSISITMASDGLLEGRTAYECGTDLRYTSCDDPSGYQGQEKEECIRVLLSMYKTAIAGPYAEAYFQKGIKLNLGSVKILGGDKLKVDRVSGIYQSYTNSEIDQMKYHAKYVYEKVVAHWNILQELAHLLCQSETMVLEKVEIHSVLSKI